MAHFRWKPLTFFVPPLPLKYLSHDEKLSDSNNTEFQIEEDSAHKVFNKFALDFLVQDLRKSKKASEFLASRFNEKNLLERAQTYLTVNPGKMDFFSNFDKTLGLCRFIDLVGRLFRNGWEDLSSISGRVIPKTLKMVLDTSLLKTQQYKVRIKIKVERSKERSSDLR